MMLKLMEGGWKPEHPRSLPRVHTLGSSTYFDRRLSRPKSYLAALLRVDDIMNFMPLHDGNWPEVLHNAHDPYYRAILAARSFEQMSAVRAIMLDDDVDVQQLCFLFRTGIVLCCFCCVLLFGNQNTRGIEGIGVLCQHASVGGTCTSRGRVGVLCTAA